MPASVTGDGEHTVRELVDIANSDPRRGIGHEKVLTRIKVDEAAEALVAAQGFGMDDVLPAGTEQIGFYSYGEISPHTTGRCDLHNQTMTLTVVSETA